MWVSDTSQIDAWDLIWKKPGVFSDLPEELTEISSVPLWYVERKFKIVQ